MVVVRKFGRSLLTAFCLALVGAFGTASSAQAEQPAAYMQRVANELMSAQRSGGAAGSNFASTIRNHADVASIGLTALGSYGASLPKGDRPSYYNGMVNYIARYAAKEGAKYPVAKAIVVGQAEQTASGAYVDSRITLKDGASYDVRWRLVKRGAGYKVRDAEVIGFEMTSFLNNLFQSYIAQNGGNPKALVAALNK
jgi:phospholipid transport system substrate-binding protein